MAIDFSLTQEQRAIAEVGRKMVERFEPQADAFRRAIFEEHRYPDEIWEGMAEAGFFGAVVPEEYGGSNIGLLPLTMGIEPLGGRAYAGALVLVTVMDTACIVRNGSDELKQRFLPDIAAGKTKLCFALTEAAAGTNAFRIKTHAKKDGDSYVVNGEKYYITGVNVAGYMLLVTRTTTRDDCKEQGMPKTFGFSLFLVDTKSPGITLSRLNTRGIEGHEQFTVHFDNVRVPAENLIGEQDAGALALFNSLNPERILAATIACGMSEYLIDKSVAYAKERVLFKDTPIGAYQAISHPLAQIKIDTASARHLVHHAAWSFDQNESPFDTAFWANSAKHKAAEAAIAAADRAIQTHGGSGFDADVGVIQYLDATRLMKTAPISAEMVLNFVAEHQLGLPRGY